MFKARRNEIFGNSGIEDYVGHVSREICGEFYSVGLGGHNLKVGVR